MKIKDITDQYVLNEFWSGKILYMNKSSFTDDVKQYLKNRYIDSKSFKETMWRIKYHIDIRPTCKYCGKETKFKGKVNYIFSDFCSKECKHNSGLIGLHIKQTKEKLYGNKNYVNSNKAKQTKLERYGNSSYHNIEKMKQTNINKYGCENVFSNKDIINKCKITKLNKYCDENYNNNKKIKQTKLERYGNENYTNPEKNKRTCLEKYGVESYTKTNEYIEKTKQTNLKKYGKEYYTQTKEYIEKTKQTNLKKYGVDNISKSIITKNKLSKIISSEEVQNKINQTKKKNNTFNTSKPEEESYLLLKEKYLDVKRQYRSDVYPFNCDFYIPSLDLYIECQYGQFHHHRPYIGDKQDIKDVEILKEKSERIRTKNNVKKSRYDVELETWTIRDVKKRKIAKENKLNYIEFWNINELKIWINN